MSKKVLWILFLVFLIILVLAGKDMVGNFPQYYPDTVIKIQTSLSSFFDEVVFPIKAARLSLEEPDTEVLMPVYGVRIREVTDSWHGPRSEGRIHEGQDIFASRGTPVFSGTSGYVWRVGDGDLGGNYVMVLGAGGRRYYYAHLDKIAEGLKRGQPVTIDTVLGFVGNTGNAVGTPYHLHFGVYVYRTAINPLPLLINR